MSETCFHKTIKNPDALYVQDLKKRQKANNGYCPCQLDKTPDTKCPCKTFRETNECCCGQYIRVPAYEE